MLYVTNGETTDYAHTHDGTICVDPRARGGLPGLRVRVPGRRGARAGRVRARPAVRPVAGATRRRTPATPDVLGRCHDQAVLPQPDRRSTLTTAALPMFDFTLRQVLRRPAGRPRCSPSEASAPSTLKYRINGGAVHTAATSEWTAGREVRRRRRDLLPPDARRGHGYRARATRSRSGSPAAARRSDSFTYQAVSETRNRVLVVAAEDYTGASPVQAPAPNYLSYYRRPRRQRHRLRRLRRRRERAHRARRARRAQPLRRRHLVHRRRRRHPRAGLGRRATPTASPSTSCCRVRDYLNEGGQVLYTGKYAGHQYGQGRRQPAVRPVREQRSARTRRSRRAACRWVVPATA